MLLSREVFALPAVTLTISQSNSMHVRAAAKEMVAVIVRETIEKKACLAPCVTAAGSSLSPVSQLLEELRMDLCARYRVHKAVMFPHE